MLYGLPWEVRGGRWVVRGGKRGRVAQMKVEGVCGDMSEFSRAT
jgi:hypothetical protein